MELSSGGFYDIDILIGEGLGGHFYAFLFFEQEGAVYNKDNRGNPVLPIFRVADTNPPDAREVMPPYAKNGPLWKAQPPAP
jgi:hypothetical protein